MPSRWPKYIVLLGVVYAFFLFLTARENGVDVFLLNKKWRSVTNEPVFIIIVDGLIFKLQSGAPKGISNVWRDVFPGIAAAFPPPHRIIFLQRTPDYDILKPIREAPHVEIIKPAFDSLDEVIKTQVLASYRSNGLLYQQDLGYKNPVVVFFSTYYSFPSLPGICNILLYHDLIPEKVGMYAGPGSEYYLRVEILDRIQSIIAVSNSTARDLIETYGEKLNRTAYVNKLLGDEHFSDYHVSVVHNRIERQRFPGPANADQIENFRKKYNIFTPQVTKHTLFNGRIPRNYFILIGSSYEYKNQHIVVQSLDHFSDDFLSNTVFVLAGHSALDTKTYSKHMVLLSKNGGEYTKIRDGAEPPIRVNVIPHLEDSEVSIAISGALGLVYTSSYEGFGLPVAEAMTCGTIPVTTNASSLPEVGGPKTFYVNNPKSPQETAQVIEQVFQLSQTELDERIRFNLKYVEQFGGGGSGGLEHSSNEMSAKYVGHIKSNIHRGKECYKSFWSVPENDLPQH